MQKIKVNWKKMGLDKPWTKKEERRWRQLRANLAEHESKAKRMGMKFNTYVRTMAPFFMECGGKNTFGVLYRKYLWKLDRMIGKNWWKN